MTNRRYLSYRRVLALLGASVPEPDETEEVTILRARAQDLLLTRPHQEDEVEDLEHDAATALRELVADGALTSAVAVELWRALTACGPPQAPLEREAVVPHAIL